MKIKFSIFGTRRSLNAGAKVDNQAPPTTTPQAKFRLIYKNFEIGTLELKDGQWLFEYSEWFKEQKNIKPFANFPDVSRQYVSDTLPPFFESRLPGVSQPQVEKYLKDKTFRSEGETKAELLKNFGRRTVSNPFELQFAL